jgi:SpoU rRNA methylase family enzyme
MASIVTEVKSKLLPELVKSGIIVVSDLGEELKVVFPETNMLNRISKIASKLKFQMDEEEESDDLILSCWKVVKHCNDEVFVQISFNLEMCVIEIYTELV